MVTSNIEAFQKICGQVFISVPLAYRWQWDEPLHVALVSFEEVHAGAILAAVSTGFDQEWDFSTISGASQPVRNFFTASFGLLPGQKAFTSDNGSGLTLFALWWAWGDRTKTSLRIGMFSADEQALDKAEIKERLTQWFAI
ncbi:MAG: hypothetical protein AMK69_06905 [Nitrospira bacterium SG8_3]|nr:MAG: hypothetical protein AMK69_06905 [Nitrospira bacterium SG8_3]